MPERHVASDRRCQAGLLLLGAVTLLALCAPLIAGADPTAQPDVIATRFTPPLEHDHLGTFHLLGTDRFGRDVWSRLVFGARVSLATGFLATALALVIGVAVGLLAGVWRGRLGLALLAVTDFALAVPRVVLLLLLAALWEPGAGLVVLVLGITGWMSIARLVYGEATSLMARTFVTAAQALGADRRRVAMTHILPNALTPVIVAAALGVGNAITLEAGLSFLGLGAQPPTPSWGAMIASGRDTLVNAPWVAVAPGVALVLVVVGCTLVGDALREGWEAGGAW
jgi:ABC-type dipeptide/oligopeptide/nickel transport system permease subunit